MAIAAADPAPAEVMTWKRGSTTLPAAQTPECWFGRCHRRSESRPHRPRSPSPARRPSAWGTLTGPDEHRGSRDHATVDQLDTGQPVSIDHEPRDLTVHDLDAASLQLLERVDAQVERVGEEDNVVRPLTNQQRVLDGVGPRAQHPDGLVADLPAVAIRAVQQVAAPSLANARDVRQLVADPGREQDPSRLQDSASGQPDGEPGSMPTTSILDQLDAVAADLGASRGQQVGRRHPVAGQEPLHVRCRCVAGRSGVDHRDPAPGAAEDERGTQAGRPAADDQRRRSASRSS